MSAGTLGGWRGGASSRAALRTRATACSPRYLSCSAHVIDTEGLLALPAPRLGQLPLFLGDSHLRAPPRHQPRTFSRD